MSTERMYPYDFPGIYRWLNLVNGKSYIGQAVNIRARLHEHRRRRTLKGPSPLYRAVAKYGWNAFAASVVERVNNVELLDEREQHWIKVFKSSVHEHGYNICLEPICTTRGRLRSKEERNVISEHAKKRVGALNHFFGKKHSEETKQRISEKKRSQKLKLSTEHNRAIHAASGIARRKPVRQIDPKTGGVIKVWACAYHATNELGISPTGIAQVLSGKAKTAGGFRWDRA